MSADRRRLPLRRPSFAMVVLLLCQFAVGMVVNLDVTVPAHHPGAHPSSYLSGSASSVGWAIAHGPVALAIHAALGLALVVLAVVAAARALRNRAGRGEAVVGALLIIGAGFNGASFLDFNHDTNSLIMALLFAAATLSYAVLLYRSPPRGG